MFKNFKNPLAKWMPSLFEHRFGLFLAALLNSLILPILVKETEYETTGGVFTLIFILVSGFFLYYSFKKTIYVFIILALINFIIRIFVDETNSESLQIADYLLYFFILLMLGLEICIQVAQSKKVSLNIVFGILSGYVLIALLGGALLNIIMVNNPEAITNISSQDDITYFAFITTLTIGYGEMVPIDPIAKRVCILMALIGQFYFSVVIAIIVSKYIIHKEEDNK